MPNIQGRRKDTDGNVKVDFTTGLTVAIVKSKYPKFPLQTKLKRWRWISSYPPLQLPLKSVEIDNI